MTKQEFVQLQIGALEARIANSEAMTYDLGEGIVRSAPVEILNGYIAELQYWKEQL